MKFHNNWITSNFLDIAYNRSERFQVQFHPYPFTPMQFHDAAVYTMNLIKEQTTKPLYLGLTGGADSEYIARLLCKHSIGFTPIIVDSGCIDKDVVYAKMLCDELALEPMIVTVSEDELLGFYLTQIAPYRSDGLTHSHQLLAIDTAKRYRGTCIVGESNIFDPNPSKAIFKAFKFLPDLRYDDVIPFYYYTLELTYAEMKEVRVGEMAQLFKARVRGTKLRQTKFVPKYNTGTLSEYQRCVNAFHPDLLMHDMGTPKDFVKYMETFIK
jgi:hypothetical protein